MAMHVARQTACTVLKRNVLLVHGAGPSAVKLQVAIASSPVLRKVLCSTTELLVAFAKLTPSAYVLRIRAPWMTSPSVNGAVTCPTKAPLPTHQPTVWCSIHTFS